MDIRYKLNREEKRHRDLMLAAKSNFLDEYEEIYDAANLSQEKLNRMDMRRRFCELCKKALPTHKKWKQHM